MYNGAGINFSKGTRVVGKERKYSCSMLIIYPQNPV
uniref:Uncharacterized protein n=1 Tax=Arundo donax TaxID=35708 RepID=A0A0A9HHP3_ARUDO